MEEQQIQKEEPIFVVWLTMGLALIFIVLVGVFIYLNIFIDAENNSEGRPVRWFIGNEENNYNNSEDLPSIEGNLSLDNQQQIGNLTQNSTYQEISISTEEELFEAVGNAVSDHLGI